MEGQKKVTLYVTKVKTQQGNIRFNLMATLPGSEKMNKELWEQAHVISKPGYEEERKKLVKEFHNFLVEIFEPVELHEVYNKRVDFIMTFGDQYKAWASVSGSRNTQPGEELFYKLHCSRISIPLTHEEIMFFFDAMEIWQIIKKR